MAMSRRVSNMSRMIVVLRCVRTSEYLPLGPVNLANWLTRALSSSSCILLFQSVRPVDTMTCKAYAGMVPLSLVSRSISKPSGVSLHWQVGEGHSSSVGMWCLSSGCCWAMGTVYVARDLLRYCDVHSDVLGTRVAILAPLNISPMARDCCESEKESELAT